MDDTSPSQPYVGRRLMTVLAHPDDETFGASATLAKYVAGGAELVMVCATRGEVGQISDLSDATPATLGQAREQELRNAAAAVGAKEVIFLDYIDGQVAAADFAELEAKVVALYRHYRPNVVITFGKEGVYGHPDHVTIGKAAVAAFQDAADPLKFADDEPYQPQKLYFLALSMPRMMRSMQRAIELGVPAVGMAADFTAGRNPGEGDVRIGGDAAPAGAPVGSPEEDITTVIDTTNFTDQKVQAIQSHRSQLAKDLPFRYVTPEIGRQIYTEEIFSHADPSGNIIRPSDGQPETDLLAGI